MLKAYHQVRRPADVDAILERGSILPVVYFMEPAQVRPLCQDFKRAFKSRHRRNPGPVAEAGFDSIVRAIEAAIMDIQESKGISPPGLPSKPEPWAGWAELPETNLVCEDLLAGDVDRVFLSVGDWMGPRGGRGSGFVYSAEELIGHGAVVRPKDLLADFIKVIDDVLMASPATPEEGRETIERGLAAALAERETSGMDALGLVRRWEGLSARELLRQGPEIVWKGPLSVELAIEVWKNGNRMEAPE